MTPRYSLPASLAIFLTLLVSCSDTSGPSLHPVAGLDEVRANPNNVLSAVAVLRAENAATAFVEYSADSITWERTPTVDDPGAGMTVPVLGLDHSTRYLFRACAVSADGDSARSTVMTLTTGALPSEIPAWSIPLNSSPTPGYTLVGLTNAETSGTFHAIIIDNGGKLRWYRTFTRPVVDFQKQPNGRYTAYTAYDGGPARFLELDNLGNVVREFASTASTETGVHELRVTDGGHALYGYDRRVTDLTSIGGRADASVTGQILEYHRPGAAPFLWRSFDHLGVEEAMPDISLTGANVNPWHMNAIEIDRDDNLMVSFRNSDQVVKIDSRSGDIIWRLGGRKNEFTFINDDLNGFSHQHGIRRLSNGNILLFDNGNLHEPPQSRAVEYRLDENARRAELVWEYRADPIIYGSAQGFAQRLANGNTLICYGLASRIIEVDHDGRRQWEMLVEQTGYFPYRAFRVGDLY